MKKYTKLIPGILLVALVQWLAGRSVVYLPWLDVITLGIVIGILVNNVWKIPDYTRAGIKFTEKQVLKWGIILLGVELNFALVWRLGGKILFLVVFMVTFGLAMSYLLGKVYKVNVKLSTLLGVGSAICGTSAIAAMEPIIAPDKEDAAMSAALISLMGAAGVLLYPLLGGAMHLPELSYGVWAGSSLQNVAHAVAAALARGDASGEIGTLVKMGRVVMLAPVALVLTSIFARGTTRKVKDAFPMYVLGFIVVGLLTTTGVLHRTYDLWVLHIDLKLLSKLLITAAMIALGLGVNLKSLGKKGLKAIALGLTLFFLISVTSLLLIRLLGIA